MNKTNLVGEGVRGSTLSFPFLVNCFPFSISGVLTSLGQLEPACCGVIVTGTEFCLALVTFSGARDASIVVEGGGISDGFTGVGLILLIRSRSGIVLDFIGARVEDMQTDGRTTGDTCSYRQNLTLTKPRQN